MSECGYIRHLDCCRSLKKWSMFLQAFKELEWYLSSLWCIDTKHWYKTYEHKPLIYDLLVYTLLIYGLLVYSILTQFSRIGIRLIDTKLWLKWCIGMQVIHTKLYLCNILMQSYDIQLIRLIYIGYSQYEIWFVWKFRNKLYLHWGEKHGKVNLF